MFEYLIGAVIGAVLMFFSIGFIATRQQKKNEILFNLTKVRDDFFKVYNNCMAGGDFEGANLVSECLKGVRVLEAKYQVSGEDEE